MPLVTGRTRSRTVIQCFDASSMPLLGIPYHHNCQMAVMMVYKTLKNKRGRFSRALPILYKNCRPCKNYGTSCVSSLSPVYYTIFILKCQEKSCIPLMSKKYAGKTQGDGSLVFLRKQKT